MKSIIVIILLAVSTLAQAGESFSDTFYQKLGMMRSELVKAAGPFQRSLVVDELVEKMSMLDVDVKVSTRSLSEGALYFPGVIIIGKDMANLPREQLAFIIAHEYGHHMRTHWHSTLSRGVGLATAKGKSLTTVEELVPFLQAAVTPETSHADEHEADRTAVMLLKQYGLFSEKSLFELFSNLGEGASDTHPSTVQRLQVMLGLQ